MRNIILLTLLLVFSLPSHAQAESNTIPAPDIKFGLAMHGEPKYGPNDEALDYVNVEAPKGGSIKIAATGTFDTLNPYSIKGKAAEGLNLVYDRLMQRVWDEPFTMYPLIARGYEMPEDRSFITFHIDERARFHDGSSITADDVRFSFETLKESGRPNMRRVYRLIEKVDQIDDYTISFFFVEGADRETPMILALMPVLSKAYWEERIAEGKAFDSTTLDVPLLNGPYTIKSVDPGRSITYERVKNYWAADLLANKGHFNFDEVIYDYYRDDTVAFEAFKAGDFDFRREWDAGKWASAYTFPAIESGEIVAEALPHGRPERTRGFIFNARREPFDDPRVRQALQLAFDHKWINENIYHGQYKTIRSYFPNSEFEGYPQTQQTDDSRQRLRQATRLLKDAGWSVDEGILKKEGRPFAFELLINAPEEEKVALNFKRNLERLGIDMNIRVLDTASFRGRLNDYDYDMVSYFWQSSLSPGTEQVLYWGCEAAKQAGRFNYAGICEEEIDALAASIAQTVSREELVEAMRELDRKLIDGHYMVPLFYAGEDYVAYQSKIKRPQKTPLYGLVIESWWAER